MKKILLLLIICATFVGKAKAQDQEGIFSVSGNLGYGTEVESLGIGLRAQYGFTSNIRGAAEYKYYISRNAVSMWEINADAHYVFGSRDELVFYPIAGLKFARITFDSDRIDNLPGIISDYKVKVSENRIGFNLGFGSQIAIAERLSLQPEVRYEIMKDYSQFVAMCGITYSF